MLNHPIGGYAYQAQEMSRADPCTKAPPIEVQAARVGEEFEILCEAVGRLADALAPVLTPQPPSADSGQANQAQSIPIQSRMADQLAAHAARIGSLRTAVQSLIHRLEL